jgi:hypothetical protein
MAGGLPPVFTRHSRNRSSLLPDAPSPKSSQGSARGMPLAREAKRVLGMGGTMGGSDASGYEAQELDASDPDSDIPDELQVILASGGHSPVDDTLSFRPLPVHDGPLLSPGLPPHAPLPVPDVAIFASLPQIQLPVLVGMRIWWTTRGPMRGLFLRAWVCRRQIWWKGGGGKRWESSRAGKEEVRVLMWVLVLVRAGSGAWMLVQLLKVRTLVLQRRSPRTIPAQTADAVRVRCTTQGHELEVAGRRMLYQHS